MKPPISSRRLALVMLLLLSHHSLSLRLPTTPTLPAQTLPLLAPPPTPLAYVRNCIPKRGFFTRAPSYYDCVRAILQLPNLVGPGSFHNAAPDDVFRLPVRKSHGSCAVRVELRHEGSARQSASWHVIVARALSLNEFCIDTPLRAPENAGGWIELGRQQRLLVILESTGQRAVGVGAERNVTVL